MTAYRWDGDDLILNLRVSPRSAKDDLLVEADRLKVRITAPPIDGKANKHLLKYLGKCFGVPQSRVDLIRGDNSRSKVVRVHRPRQLPEIITRDPC